MSQSEDNDCLLSGSVRDVYYSNELVNTNEGGRGNCVHLPH